MSEILCHCQNLSFSAAKKIIIENEKISYGDFIYATKATLTCGDCTKRSRLVYIQTIWESRRDVIIHSFFDQEGELLFLKKNSPLQIVLGVESLFNDWKKLRKIDLEVSFISYEGLHFKLSSSELSDDLKLDFADLVLTQTGLLIFLFDKV